SVTMKDDGIEAHAGELAPGKYTWTVRATDFAGHTAEAHASTFSEARPGRTLDDGLIYQILVDRFAATDAPPDPGARAGGTLDGVRTKIESGYFESLGVSTLWLSPLYQNPPGREVGRDGRLYEAYHGYWPIAPRSVEPKLGGEVALDAVVEAAHARGLRVILDAVPNHVHQTHPYRIEHPSWFNESCICGAAQCDWAGHIEECW